MVSDVTIVFEPEGKNVKTKLEKTAFQAAKEAGVGVRSECGGKGLCGKCVVIVKDAGAVGGVTEVERRHLSR